MTETRTLYVPEGISYDAQFEHGVKLFKAGSRVTIHDHAQSDDHCQTYRCGVLTDGPKGPTLDSINKNE